MNKPEFDKFANQYDQIMGDTIPGKFNEDSYFTDYKIALITKKTKGRDIKRILDYGCGSGRSLPYLEKYFPTAELFGYDVSPASLEFASQRSPSTKLFSNWQDLTLNSFDLIMSANVFHHITPSHRLATLTQCSRTLTKKGQFFLFEHNPYNPATRWIFERCPFDVDAEMLNLKQALSLSDTADLHVSDYGYTLFFPRQLAFLRGLEPYMRWIPIGAQYFVSMEKMASTSP